jgi:hypothetical protein
MDDLLFYFRLSWLVKIVQFSFVLKQKKQKFKTGILR